MIPADMQKRSMLLLTRFDKINSHEDRQRVLRRVAKETKGLFAEVFPISLTDALDAGDDRDAWVRSGAESFLQALINQVHELGTRMGSRFETDLAEGELDEAEFKTGVAETFQSHETTTKPVDVAGPAVMPKRVAPVRPDRPATPRRSRPERHIRTV